MTENTYTYSQLSSESVSRLVSIQYDLDKDLACKFYVLGLHDNYLVESEQQKYILRIYRNNWRTEKDISFELEWLAYLNSHIDTVAELIETRHGEYTFQIASPEGLRFACLFRYADGNAPGISMDVHDAGLLGQTVATIHDISDMFTPKHTRQDLDTQYLLDHSISNIKPFLDKQDIVYLCDLQEKLSKCMPSLEKTPGMYGLCIGDVNPTNFHIHQRRKITIFDFDQCGYGYRAFEIGKFFSAVRHHKNKQELQEAFLDSYQNIRPLHQNELTAIPLFEIISVIWVMSIQVENADRIGYKYLEKPSWDKRFRDFRELVATWPGSTA